MNDEPKPEPKRTCVAAEPIEVGDLVGWKTGEGTLRTFHRPPTFAETGPYHEWCEVCRKVHLIAIDCSS